MSPIFPLVIVVCCFSLIFQVSDKNRTFSLPKSLRNYSFHCIVKVYELYKIVEAVRFECFLRNFNFTLTVAANLHFSVQMINLYFLVTKLSHGRAIAYVCSS